MSSFIIGPISTGRIFRGALLGMGLARRLPGHHLSKEMQDLVKLSAETIATLTALVLGLFVSFGLFAPRNFMILTVLFVGDCASSAAIFFVLELNQPLDGLIKVSSVLPIVDAEFAAGPQMQLSVGWVS